MELEQSDWCTMGLGHNVSSTQPEWNKTGLVHNRLTPFLAPSPPPHPPSQSKDHSLAPGREGWTWSLWRWPTSCAACPCIPTAHSPQPLAMGHAWGRSLGPPLPPPHSRPLLASRPAANQLPRAQTRCPAWRCGSDWRRSDRPGTWGSTGWTRTRVGTGGESGKQRQGDDVSLPATAAAPATRQTVFYTILRSAASAKTAGFRHQHLLPCLLQRQRTFPDSVKLGFSFYVSSTDHSLCKSQVWQTQNFKHDKSRLKSNFECESSSTGSNLMSLGVLHNTVTGFCSISHCTYQGVEALELLQGESTPETNKQDSQLQPLQMQKYTGACLFVWQFSKWTLSQ